MSIESAAKDFVHARKDRKEAKAALLAFREENGGCEMAGESPGIESPCYDDTSLDSDEWCDACHGSQPLWLKRKTAGINVGVTLRKLTRVVALEEVSG